MPGVPLPSTSRSDGPDQAALTGLQLMQMASSGVMDDYGCCAGPSRLVSVASPARWLRQG